MLDDPYHIILTTSLPLQGSLFSRARPTRATVQSHSGLWSFVGLSKGENQVENVLSKQIVGLHGCDCGTSKDIEIVITINNKH